MGCEPYKTLSLYLHLLWNPCSLQAYHIVKLYQNYITTEKPAELKSFNCSDSICLCANPSYSCYFSPKAARINASLWQPPLPKVGKIMSLSWCSCTQIFLCFRTPPTALFSSTYWLFLFPHCYFSFFIIEGAEGFEPLCLCRLQLKTCPSLGMANRVKLDECKPCFARF